MKGLFSLENPLMQFLSLLCDLMILNVLFLISCLPVFTIGAAICGMNKACQAVVMDDERSMIKLYFSGFKSSFKQATVAWLVTLAVIAGLVCYWFLVTNFIRGTLAAVVLILMVVIAVIALSILSYLYPLITRYNNTLREHLRNASILTITRPLLTICLLIMNAAPFILPIISLQSFLRFLFVWFLVGFAFLCYLMNQLIKPVYVQLEASNADSSAEEEEEE